MKTGTIYMLEFPDGERYIGQTTLSLQQRFANGNGYKNCPAVSTAIERHGWNTVKVDILYRDIPVAALNRYEMLCISRWQILTDGNLNSTLQPYREHSKKRQRRTEFEVFKLANLVSYSQLTEREIAETLKWTFNEVRSIKGSQRFKRLYQQVLESATEKVSETPV